MNFFQNFVNTLHDLFTSKKFLTAVATGVAAYQSDGDARKAIVAVGVALILGQGAADFGKEAKK